jgi:hypothetical protein
VVATLAEGGLIKGGREAAPKPKNDLYRDLLPLVNSRLVNLLDHSEAGESAGQPRRRTAHGGRDRNYHRPGLTTTSPTQLVALSTPSPLVSAVTTYNIAPLA